MSNHNTAPMNGAQQRKTLANQLDRLDNIIDAMADGLPKTIADVVCQAISAALPQAIQAVITQVLSQPEVLRQLAGLNAPVPAASPATNEAITTAPAQMPQTESAAPSSRSKLGTAWGWLRTTTCNTGTWVCSKLPSVREGVCAAGRKVWQHRYLVALSLAIGVMVGCTSFVAGPLLSSMALGLCGAAASAGAYLAAPFVRLWKSMQPQPQ